MKYTNYLIKGDFIHMDSIISDKTLLKVPSRIVSIPVAVMGLLTLLGFLPLTLMIDELRNTKCRYIYFKRSRVKV